MFGDRSVLCECGSSVKIKETHRRKTEEGTSGFFPTQVKN